MLKDTSTIAFVLIALILIALAADVRRSMKIYFMRQKGLFPKKGQEATEDVERLLKIGERNMAIYCYRLISKASLKKAINEVKKIELNLM